MDTVASPMAISIIEPITIKILRVVEFIAMEGL